MTFKPLHENILVFTEEKKERKTSIGLYIPDEVSQGNVAEGIVVAVGSGRFLPDGKKAPLEVKEGDKVLYSRASSIEVTLDGKAHKLLSEDSVLAIIN